MIAGIRCLDEWYYEVFKLGDLMRNLQYEEMIEDESPLQVTWERTAMSLETARRHS